MARAYQKWRHGLFAALVMIVATGLAEGRGLYDKPPQLVGLIEELLNNNEELQSMAEECAALEAEVSVAGTLDDPRLGIGVASVPTDTFSFSQEPMTQKQLFIAQKLPWFGKLDLRTQQAVVAVERQQALIEARRLELIKALSDTFYELGFVSRSLEVNAELIRMVEQMLQVTESGYASGRGLQQDVFQAQVELGKLFDEKVGLENRRRALAARINELLNRSALEEVRVPADLAVPAPELDLDPGAIRQLALTHHPVLRVRQADIDRSALNVDLARKNYYPDVDVNLAYGQREEDRTGRDLPDFVSGSVTISLPLWQKKKQDQQLVAAQNRYKAAAKSYENLRHALPHQVGAVLSAINAARENHRLFKGGLLEQTRNWSHATLSAYEVGKVDFDTMIDAHVRALRFELQAEQYRYQFYRKLTELEVLAGIIVTDIDMAAASAAASPVGVSGHDARSPANHRKLSSGVN